MERRGVDNTSCKLYVGNYTGTGSAPCALKYKWDPVIYTDVKTCFTDAVLYISHTWSTLTVTLMCLSGKRPEGVGFSLLTWRQRVQPFALQ